MSESKTFMGIPIEGDTTGYGRYERDAQEPIENLYPHIRRAFDNGVKAIKWAQYTPYFNDGEPCEFSIYDHYVTSDPRIANLWVNNNNYDEDTDDYFDFEEYIPPSARSIERWGNDHPDQLTREDHGIPVNEERFEDALRSAFGDHTEIVITPERVIQFEYEHE